MNKIELKRKLENMSNEEFLTLLENKGITISDIERQRLESGNKAARQGAIRRYHLTFGEWDFWNLEYRGVVWEIHACEKQLLEVAKSTDRSISEVFEGDFCTSEERAEASNERDLILKRIEELKKQRDYLLSVEP